MASMATRRRAMASLPAAALRRAAPLRAAAAAAPRRSAARPPRLLAARPRRLAATAFNPLAFLGVIAVPAYVTGVTTLMTFFSGGSHSQLEREYQSYMGFDAYDGPGGGGGGKDDGNGGGGGGDEGFGMGGFGDEHELPINQLTTWLVSLLSIYAMLKAIIWLSARSVLVEKSNTTHVVKPGETLALIALHLGTSVSELVAANADIEVASKLQIGYELKIPDLLGLEGASERDLHRRDHGQLELGHVGRHGRIHGNFDTVHHQLGSFY